MRVLRLMGLTALFLPPALSAQVITVPDRVECESCGIRLERVLILGSDAPEAGVERVPRTVTRDANGRYYAVPWRGNRVLVFGPDGVFERDLARAGLGPGEVTGATLVQPSGDSLFVFDFRARRVTVFDLDGTYQRSMPLSGTIEAAIPMGGGGTWVLSGDFAGGGSIGYPLHTFDATGAAAVTHFGSDGTYHPGMVGGGIERRIAPTSNPGTVWSAPTRNYTIEEWTADGELVRQVRRETKWFPPNWPQAMPTRDKPRPPLVIALREVVPRRLLVIVSVTSPEWLEHATCFDDKGVEVCAGDSGSGVWGGRLELIDVEAGKLLARTDVDVEILGFIDSETVWSFRYDVVGHPFIEIWRVSYPSL